MKYSFPRASLTFPLPGIITLRPNQVHEVAIFTGVDSRFVVNISFDIRYHSTGGLSMTSTLLVAH